MTTVDRGKYRGRVIGANLTNSRVDVLGLLQVLLEITNQSAERQYSEIVATDDEAAVAAINREYDTLL